MADRRATGKNLVSLPNFFLIEHGRAANVLASGFGRHHAAYRTLANKFAFELSDGAEDVVKKLAAHGGRIDPLAYRAELDTGFMKAL